MSHLANSHHICWRCVGRQPRAATRRIWNQNGDRLTRASTLRRAHATVHDSTDSSGRRRLLPAAGYAQSRLRRSFIREQLQVWEANNPAPVTLLPRDEAAPGAKANVLTRSQTSASVELDWNESSEHVDQPFFEGDDLEDLRSAAAGIEPGDLVSVTADTHRGHVLAICLGTFNGSQHYYTSTGKWFTNSGYKSQFNFVVKRFVGRDLLDPIVNALPPKSASMETLQTLQRLKAGPSREIGQNLIRRMASFRDDARVIYQSSVLKLDRARQLLPSNGRLMSLSEIADILLSPALKSKGRYSPAALYSVHVALLQDDVSIQALSGLGKDQTYMYQVHPANDALTVNRVEARLRTFLDDFGIPGCVLEEDVLQCSTIGRFLLKARLAIDQSRSSRDWSPHGILAPASSPALPFSLEWSDSEIELIQFIHLWAASRRFSRASHLHWIGPTILRFLNRYQGCDYHDETIAWAFLQEIGWLKPWEIQARYQLCLAGVNLERGGGVERAKDTPSEVSLGPDIFEGRRKDWANIRAYCIDSAEATELDDAISVEHTDTPGVYWIRVHIADPAAFIRPRSSLAIQASSVPQTTYLPGHFSRMLSEGIGEKFSLGSNRPCLTFSARVDDSGRMLEYNIKPAILRDVTAITNSVAAAACGLQSETSSESRASFAVGKAPKQTERHKSKTELEDLTADDLNNLNLLSRLAKSLHNRRVKNGAGPSFNMSSDVKVSFEHVTTIKSPDGFMRCSGDPYIEISQRTSGYSEMVASSMLLAGEIAARWCHERGVPIPYLGQPLAARNLDQLRTFTSNVLYPSLAAGQPASPSDWETMRLLCGGFGISCVPTINYMMGLDMYTRATSPLRRYSDLLVHWQIEATLLEEERSGISLVGNAGDLSFLPFSRQELERDVFPSLRVRESNAKLLNFRKGTKQWMLQALVRAWKFGEGEPKLPESFRFKVTHLLGLPNAETVSGELDWFAVNAKMSRKELSRLLGDGEAATLNVANIREGDMYEVELKDIDMLNTAVWVKPLRRMETDGH